MPAQARERRRVEVRSEQPRERGDVDRLHGAMVEAASEERWPACDRRDPADQAGQGAPLTTHRPAPTLPSQDLI